MTTPLIRVLRTLRALRTIRTGVAGTWVCACMVVVASTSLPAQGAYTGAWHVSAWKVAPWVSAAQQAGIKPNTLVLNHDIRFRASKIVGPKVIACAAPKYEVRIAPFENLFEGGLKNPASDAAALGFKAPVKTLMPGCDMEFHSLNANSAMFALDNVLYTMVRGATK